jgi:hypothetical protein
MITPLSERQLALENFKQRIGWTGCPGKIATPIIQAGEEAFGISHLTAADLDVFCSALASAAETISNTMRWHAERQRNVPQ